MTHFAFAPGLSRRKKLWLTLVQLVIPRSRAGNALVDVWCPKSHRHPVLVWTRTPCAYERGDIVLSDCPDDNEVPDE